MSPYSNSSIRENMLLFVQMCLQTAAVLSLRCFISFIWKGKLWVIIPDDTECDRALSRQTRQVKNIWLTLILALLVFFFFMAAAYWCWHVMFKEFYWSYSLMTQVFSYSVLTENSFISLIWKVCVCACVFVSGRAEEMKKKCKNVNYLSIYLSISDRFVFSLAIMIFSNILFI